MPGCVTSWSRASRSSQSRNHCYAADDLVVHLHGDLGGPGDEDVHARSELYHPETVPRVHGHDFFDAADNAPHEHADNLTDDDGLAVMIDRDLGIFVEV